jgi:hypothetical protein
MASSINVRTVCWYPAAAAEGLRAVLVRYWICMTWLFAK